MKMFDYLFEKAYAPTDEQKGEVVDLMNDHCEAIVKFGGHMYAQGWRDHMVPFVGFGLVAGAAIGYIFGKNM